MKWVTRSSVSERPVIGGVHHRFGSENRFWELKLCEARSQTRSIIISLWRMHRLELTDGERAILISALRRLIDLDPQSASPQLEAAKAMLARLEEQKPQPVPDTASTG